MMKFSLTLICLFIIWSYSRAQENGIRFSITELELQNGMLISLDDDNSRDYKVVYEDLEGLEDFGINLDSVTKDQLFCLAIDQCDLDLVRFFINNGANVNAKWYEDDVITYVTYCIEDGAKMAKMMIENGANINGTDQDSDPLLSYAIGYDNFKLVKYLIANGADTKHTDTNLGCLPIHSCESLQMLKLLIENGFEVNEICTNGRNLLHFAARNDLFEIAQYLIENKLVDINLKDANGDTPLDYSINYRNPEIEKLIKSR